MTKTIIARDGYIFTDGETYGTQIRLADGVDESDFHEISEAEYEEILHKNVEVLESGI
jgi:hypothetical protein